MIKQSYSAKLIVKAKAEFITSGCSSDKSSDSSLDDQIKPPLQVDLVVAFNSGIHLREEDETVWDSKSLRLMALTTKYVLLTSHTHEEALDDLKAIKKVIPELLNPLYLSSNPFASRRPLRDGSVPNGLFFANSVWQAFQTLLS